MSIGAGRKLIEQRGERALGPHPKHSAVRVMVTMPSEAASDYELVKNLIAEGMNVARINCANDALPGWRKMVEHVRQAEQELGKKCLIVADLAGPKLRTGAMEPGPQVVKVRPWRDKDTGKLIRPARILLSNTINTKIDKDTDASLPISAAFLKRVQIGHRIHFTDNRGSRRSWEVKEVNKDGVVVETKRRAWIKTGTELGVKIGLRDFTGLLGKLPPVAQAISVRVGSLFIFT